MGRCYLNWLSKASRANTAKYWRYGWRVFSTWAGPVLGCKPDEVDVIIVRDFEDLPSHLFQRKHRDLLEKYMATLSSLRRNSARNIISAVRSFYGHEAAEIKFRSGMIPAAEMAMNEHRFSLNDFQAMWSCADYNHDWEGMAWLSTAVSLGWSVGDIIGLKRRFIENVLGHIDGDGYAVFDYSRKKTGARVRGILNPDSVRDLRNYLSRTKERERLWSVETEKTLNLWFKELVEKASVKTAGSVRFHLIRKYVFNVMATQCGEYEAKLLVGKSIPLADATYLQGLEDSLLLKYKKFAYPFLKLGAAEPVMKENSQEMLSLRETVKALMDSVVQLQNEMEAMKNLRSQSSVLD